MLLRKLSVENRPTYCHPRLNLGSRNVSYIHIYILANKRNGTLYVGSTSQLLTRITQHKNKLVEGFTKKYNVTIIVYFEEVSNALEMVKRERQIKAWDRKWKLKLIEKKNPSWKDLYNDIL